MQIGNYERELKEMEKMSRQESIRFIRRYMGFLPCVHPYRLGTYVGGCVG